VLNIYSHTAIMMFSYQTCVPDSKGSATLAPRLSPCVRVRLDLARETLVVGRKNSRGVGVRATHLVLIDTTCGLLWPCIPSGFCLTLTFICEVTLFTKVDCVAGSPRSIILCCTLRDWALW